MSFRVLRPFHSVAAPQIPRSSSTSTTTTPIPTPSSYHFDYPHLLRSCKNLDSLLRIHAHLLVRGADSTDLTLTHLINSYSSFNRPHSALSLFKSSPNPTTILWNSMLRSYSTTGHHTNAIHFYHHMLVRGVEPDNYTFTFLLKACAGATDSRTGHLVHQQILRRGLQGDVFIGTGLVNMYSKLGSIEAARDVFESMTELDVVSWNAMIAGFAQSCNPHEALGLCRKMQAVGVAPNSVTFLNLFPAICELSALLLCRALHGFVARRCILPCVSNGLIDAYSKCGSSEVARRVFDGMSDACRDDVSWGTMISGYVHNRCFEEALQLFDDLRRENVKLNQVSVVSALLAASERRELGRGLDIHDYAIQRGMDLDTLSVGTILATMHAKYGDVGNAKLHFYDIEEKDIVAWSAMISAFVQIGQPEEAISLFREMLLECITPNRVTIVSILPACADLSDRNLGKSIHCFALKSNFGLDVSMGTALVAMYAQCGLFTSAHRVFAGLEHKDVVTWNALISGYAQFGDAGNALQMFRQARSTGHRPDPGTMVGVLPACALLSSLDDGACVHGLVIKSGFESDVHVRNATIDMYAKCGELSSSESLFFESNSCDEDIISWNTMIAGYMHNGRANKALSAFHQMRGQDVKPNLVTLVSVLPATAYIAALREGSVVHSYAIRTGLESRVLVGNSLIDMYSKCGRVSYARDLFNQMDYRDTVSWNTMLAGYAIHGLGESAIALFSQMKDNRIIADSVSFISVLSACRHGGLVEEGRKVFDSMKSEHQLEPNVEHYACMVDLLGRAGGFGEAWGLIQRMPMTPDACVWGALLGACRMHSNVGMGERAVDELIKLEPRNPAHHVVLSNIYAQVGKWGDVRKMREAMNRTGLKKTPGCSWVEIDKNVHAFKAGDRSHPRYESIRNVWNDMTEKMEKMGYVPDTSSVLQNVEEEEKGSFLYGHSERLAISFAILSTEPGVTIQIVKNLRVCGDCHTVTKLVSRITGRTIIVRDSSRFHLFENGVCSCKDYW